MAEPNKPKRTSAKSSKAKATSLTSKDEAIEDAVVVEDNNPDTLKNAETPDDVVSSDKDASLSSDKDLTVEETAQIERGIGTLDGKADTSAIEPGDTMAGDAKTDDIEAIDEARTSDGMADQDLIEDQPKSIEPQVTPEVKIVQTPPVVPVTTPTPEPQGKGGFVPMVLGGAIAAGLGAGALFVAQDRGWLDLGGNTDALTVLIEQQKSQIETQATQIGTLETSLQAAMARIDAVAAAEPDLTPVTNAIDALKTQAAKATSDLETISTSVAAIDPRIAELMTRINEVETQPIPKAEIPAEVTAAFERKLADMLASVDTRFGELQATQASKVTTIETALNGKVSDIEAALTAKLAALEAAQAAAVASEEDLAKAASLAAARSAMAQIEMALDSGAGFADELATLSKETGLAAPDALSAVATDGTATLAELKSSFPAAARDALAAATRDAAANGDVSPLSAFLRTQLGARSLEPREGSDPDAVLSRAEAAVASANLDQALGEIATLPQSGQDVLYDWVASAKTRRAALDAAAALSAQISTN